MKKSIIIATFLAMAVGAAAQDTIRFNGPLPNYFSNHWPYECDTLGCPELGVTRTQTDVARGFVNSDTLTIYGLAGMLIPSSFQSEFADLYEDTSADKLMEYLRLYFPSGDTLVRYREQLMVHLNVPSYYLLIEKVNAGVFPPDSFPPLPVYERYFSSPVQVTDTFYVGRSNESFHYADPPYCYTSRGVSILAFLCNHVDREYRNLNAHRDEATGGWHIRNWQQTDYFLYAILTPPDNNYQWDTTVVAGDTIVAGDTLIVTDTVIIGNDTVITYDTILAIPDAGLLGRLTGVMPNPAAEAAKVVSSFGVKRVEAYNMAGEKVHDQRVPDGSLSATLDVRRWPTGAYILRIHTPRGVTAKKLTVRR